MNNEGQPAFGSAYKIIEAQGVKIGIVGFLTQYIPHWEKPSIIKDLTFESVLTTAKNILPDLRQSVDLLIVAYRGGFARDLQTGLPTESLTGENEAYQLLEEYKDYIDALMTEHQHREIADYLFGVPVIQPGYRGAFVGEIELELDNHKKVVGSSAKLHKTENCKVSQEVNHLISAVSEEAEDWLDQPMGETHGEMIIRDPMIARLIEHPYIELINKNTNGSDRGRNFWDCSLIMKLRVLQKKLRCVQF